MTSEIPKNCINCEFKSNKEHEAYQRQFEYGGPGFCARDPMGEFGYGDHEDPDFGCVEDES